MSMEPARKAVAALGLPSDVILGDVMVYAVGCHKMRVENYRSLLLYTDTLIRIQTRNCRLILRGKGLCIECYTVEEMIITGRIFAIEFEV